MLTDFRQAIEINLSKIALTIPAIPYFLQEAFGLPLHTTGTAESTIFLILTSLIVYFTREDFKELKYNQIILEALHDKRNSAFLPRSKESLAVFLITSVIIFFAASNSLASMKTLDQPTPELDMTVSNDKTDEIILISSCEPSETIVESFRDISCTLTPIGLNVSEINPEIKINWIRTDSSQQNNYSFTIDPSSIENLDTTNTLGFNAPSKQGRYKLVPEAVGQNISINYSIETDSGIREFYVLSQEQSSINTARTNSVVLNLVLALTGFLSMISLKFKLDSNARPSRNEIKISKDVSIIWSVYLAGIFILMCTVIFLL